MPFPVVCGNEGKEKAAASFANRKKRKWTDVVVEKRPVCVDHVAQSQLRKGAGRVRLSQGTHHFSHTATALLQQVIVWLIIYSAPFGRSSRRHSASWKSSEGS